MNASMRIGARHIVEHGSEPRFIRALRGAFRQPRRASLPPLAAPRGAPAGAIPIFRPNRTVCGTVRES